jgi:hypothetical protein
MTDIEKYSVSYLSSLASAGQSSSVRTPLLDLRHGDQLAGGPCPIVKFSVPVQHGQPGADIVAELFEADPGPGVGVRGGRWRRRPGRRAT